jgi:hypothetical protein
MTGGGDEQPTPEEAFDVLAHELRFDILRELNGASGPVPFSDLHDAVDVRDSGQFNYHLSKVVGPFVHKSDDGYRLSTAGKRAVGTVFAGEFSGEPLRDVEPVPTEGSCHECGTGLEAVFGDSRVRIHCPSCEVVVTEPEIPPGALTGWDREELPRMVNHWLRRWLTSVDLGLCEYCDGRTITTVCRPGEPAAQGWFEDDSELDTVVVYECQRCGHWTNAIVPFAALFRPPLVAFYYDHGINLRNQQLWALDLIEGSRTAVVQETPLQVELSITLDDETRRFVFDREMTLVEESTPAEG